MKTAENILYDRGITLIDYISSSMYDATVKAMESYAEQQAIEFAEWVRARYSYNYHPEHGVWMPGKLTTEQLYQKFKEEQK